MLCIYIFFFNSIAQYIDKMWVLEKGNGKSNYVSYLHTIHNILETTNSV